MKSFHGNLHNGKRIKTIVDGITFDSRLEASYYSFLKMCKIEILDMQPKIYLSRAKILYKPDFEIVDKTTGEVVWVDTKGFSTPISNIKMRLWKRYGNGTLRIISSCGNSFEIDKEILRC